MKKFIALLLALVMVFALAACGTKTEPTPAPATDTPTGVPSVEPTTDPTGAPAGSVAGTPTGELAKIKMATGGTSGTYYSFCGIIAQVLNDSMKEYLNINAESTGASMANVQLLEAGESNMAIVQNDVMSYAYNGTSLFTEPVAGFSAVMSCYPEEVQLVANSKITSIEDLKGKTVSVGASDSGTRFNAEQILNAYGITFDDINVVYESFADSADSIKNGSVDAAFVVAGAPTTALTELATNFNFNILPIDDEHIAKLQEDYGFYTASTIPGGTYTCIADDVQTVAVMATIVASDELSEDAVYNFLLGMFNYKADIAASHAKGALIDMDTAVSGISIPFHPGAVRFYAEQGIDVA